MSNHAFVRLDRIHARQQESTLASDPKTLENQKSLDTNQEVKKYTPEIEKQERVIREQQEGLEREKQNAKTPNLTI